MTTAPLTVVACRPCLGLGLRFSLCFFFIIAGHVWSHPTGQPFSPHTSGSVVKRQNTPTTTSSFDWWPYPSWGQSTSASPPTSTVPTLSLSSLAAAEAASLSVTATTTIFTTTTAATPVFSAATPATTSFSLVHITALPPASKESSITLNRARTTQSKSTGGEFDIVWLAPLFGILAAAFGAAVAWLTYRYLPLFGSRASRSGSRESALLPGPPYGPASRFRDAASGVTASLMDEGEDDQEFDAARSPKSARGNSKVRTWLGRSMLRRNKTLPVPSAEEREPEQPPETAARDHPEPGSAEHDTFLGNAESTAVDAPDGTPMQAGRATGMSTPSQSVNSSDPYGESSRAGDAVLYETTRNKSIKRVILDRFRFGSARKANYERGMTTDDDVEINGRARSATSLSSVQHRIGHRRTDTDGHVTPLAGGTPVPSRRPTVSRTRSQQVLSPPGFRILVEDPVSGALHNEDVDFIRAPSSASSHQRQDSDKYTRLPERRGPYPSTSITTTLERTTTDVSTSPSVYSSTSPVPPRLARPAINRYESSILLSSPPIVTSPALESQLLFGSTASLHALQLPALSALRVSKPPSARANSGVPATPPNAKHHRKLKTHRQPPLLPFPSSAESSPFRNRLKKSPQRMPQTYVPLPPHAKRADSNDSVDTVSESFTTASSGSPDKARAERYGRATPAERFRARHAALEKVEAILSRSWNERDGTGTETPRNLGAVLGADSAEELEKTPGREVDLGEALRGTGIEQRLGVFTH
ncbi:hypothetical protein BD309DRAFT_959038 [Dichomitus squalens]|uniref:Uncharacterized protein n=1 Tax=Dichomitus squalens TaxID=114155 RepID=A0A4Q9NRH6_9APHY|nr:hypothetical protein BD311DRAFT_760446 [Dichomitus squalens]TBU44184.1 hypothetical protein BD309DRAFT_959038 [Dichomitus squalens]TBU54263.1 hypothetical protein BD310DRAFT_936353 [Dichomitus squalens]